MPRNASSAGDDGPLPSLVEEIRTLKWENEEKSARLQQKATEVDTLAEQVASLKRDAADWKARYNSKKTREADGGELVARERSEAKAALQAKASELAAVQAELQAANQDLHGICDKIFRTAAASATPVVTPERNATNGQKITHAASALDALDTLLSSLSPQAQGRSRSVSAPNAVYPDFDGGSPPHNHQAGASLGDNRVLAVMRQLAEVETRLAEEKRRVDSLARERDSDRQAAELTEERLKSRVKELVLEAAQEKERFMDETAKWRKRATEHDDEATSHLQSRVRALTLEVAQAHQRAADEAERLQKVVDGKNTEADAARRQIESQAREKITSLTLELAQANRRCADEAAKWKKLDAELSALRSEPRGKNPSEELLEERVVALTMEIAELNGRYADETVRLNRLVDQKQQESDALAAELQRARAEKRAASAHSPPPAAAAAAAAGPNHAEVVLKEKLASLTLEIAQLTRSNAEESARLHRVIDDKNREVEALQASFSTATGSPGGHSSFPRAGSSETEDVLRDQISTLALQLAQLNKRHAADTSQLRLRITEREHELEDVKREADHSPQEEHLRGQVNALALEVAQLNKKHATETSQLKRTIDRLEHAADARRHTGVASDERLREENRALTLELADVNRRHAEETTRLVKLFNEDTRSSSPVRADNVAALRAEVEEMRRNHQAEKSRWERSMAELKRKTSNGDRTKQLEVQVHELMKELEDVNRRHIEDAAQLRKAEEDRENAMRAERALREKDSEIARLRQEADGKTGRIDTLLDTVSAMKASPPSREHLDKLDTLTRDRNDLQVSVLDLKDDVKRKTAQLVSAKTEAQSLQREKANLMQKLHDAEKRARSISSRSASPEQDSRLNDVILSLDGQLADLSRERDQYKDELDIYKRAESIERRTAENQTMRRSSSGSNVSLARRASPAGMRGSPLASSVRSPTYGGAGLRSATGSRVTWSDGASGVPSPTHGRGYGTITWDEDTGAAVRHSGKAAAWDNDGPAGSIRRQSPHRPPRVSSRPGLSRAWRARHHLRRRADAVGVAPDAAARHQAVGGPAPPQHGPAPPREVTRRVGESVRPVHAHAAAQHRALCAVALTGESFAPSCQGSGESWPRQPPSIALYKDVVVETGKQRSSVAVQPAAVCPVVPRLAHKVVVAFVYSTTQV
ncbi:hypothetical protein DIPPA_19495 [Diplonema papillatum]|nr:hypothetical protein DIPPA_19495 [Diplonema papillatum]